MNSISLSNIIFREDPNITGTTIKKENLAAISLFNPKKIEVPMVAPLLEIPGRMAKAWEKPIINDDFRFNFLLELLNLSER